MLLNEYSQSNGIDVAPFLLIGEPAARMKSRASRRSYRRPKLEGEHGLLRLKRAKRLASNCWLLATQFQSTSGSGDVQQWLTLSKRAKDWNNKVRKAPSVLKKKEGGSANTQLEKSLGILGEGNLFKLQGAFAGVWQDCHKGYYYSIGDLIERIGIPSGAEKTTDHCPSCQSPLLMRTVELTYDIPRHDARVQYICDKCLIVKDCPRETSTGLEIGIRKDKQSMDVVFRWRNNTADPQVCHPAVWITDPNNLSISASPDSYKTLLGKRLRGENEGLELEPGKEKVWTYAVDTSDLWYLLLEFHLLVDFQLHWASATHRGPGLREWMDSTIYRASIQELAKSK